MGQDGTGDQGERGGARRPNPVDLHVGGRVRLRRMILGMSQEKLGDLLNLTFQQVQKYEKGINRIGAGRLFDLARVLGVPVSFFYDEFRPSVGAAGLAVGFEDPPRGERPPEDFVIRFLGSREGLELNKAFVRITDPQVRRAVIELVRSLAGGEEKDS